MIYQHKVSNGLYRHLFTAWNVDTQAPNEVYVCISTGRMYTRRSGEFADKFKLVDSDPQGGIVAKGLYSGPTGAEALKGALGQGS